MNNMKTRFRLIQRGTRSGKFYCVDKTTGKRTSLQTTDADAARQIVAAKNQAERQPVLNLQIAKAIGSFWERALWSLGIDLSSGLDTGYFRIRATPSPPRLRRGRRSD